MQKNLSTRIVLLDKIFALNQIKSFRWKNIFNRKVNSPEEKLKLLKWLGKQKGLDQ